LHEEDLAPGDVEVDAGERGVATEQRDGGAEADGEVHERATTLPAPPALHPTDRFRHLRRALRATGKTLIALGLLTWLFAAYQLWGTNLAEARHQRELRRELERLLAAPPPAAPATGAPATPPAADVTTPAPPSTLAPAPPPAPVGSAVALIRIPRIGVEKAVVEGVGVADLKKGPGHYPGTPLPGQPGNAAIAGHRTTYGAPFNRIDELAPGDPIFVTTRQGSFRYEVSETRIVRPSETSVLDPTPDDRLTLTSCHPKFSARQRIVVVARLVGPAAPAPAPTTPPPPAGAATPATTVPPGPPATTSAGPTAGLSGDPTARTPTLLWGAAAALVAFVVWAAGRRWRRRWAAWLLGAPVFLAVLFVFFENVSRLLPANI
jgi:sortase A